jgi:hypothetical protein
MKHPEYTILVNHNPLPVTVPQGTKIYAGKESVRIGGNTLQKPGERVAKAGILAAASRSDNLHHPLPGDQEGQAIKLQGRHAAERLQARVGFIQPIVCAQKR